MRCLNPACETFIPEYSEADGCTVCASCCTVVEENAIVSSVEFNESSGGGSATVVGTYVGAKCTKVRNGVRSEKWVVQDKQVTGHGICHFRTNEMVIEIERRVVRGIGH